MQLVIPVHDHATWRADLRTRSPKCMINADRTGRGQRFEVPVAVGAGRAVGEGEAEPLQQAAGRLVADLDRGGHHPDAGLGHQPGDQRPHRLGADALPPERRREAVADLDPAVVVGRPEGAAVADHPAVRRQGHEPATVVRPAVLHLHPQRVQRVGVRVARRPAAAPGPRRPAAPARRPGSAARAPAARCASSAWAPAHSRSPRAADYARCHGQRLGPRESDWEGVRLHVVTGKGGTGKTTVAAALAIALSGEGRRTLLVEVEGRQGIAQLFDSPPLPYEERKVAVGPGGGEVVALARRPRGGAARVPRHVLQARPGRPRAAQDRRHRLRHHHRAGDARRAAHRQGLRGRTPAEGGPQRSPRLRRRRARRAADRPHRSLPRGQRGGRGAGEGRPGPRPGRRDHGVPHLPDDRGAPRDAARGDAGAGDGRRRRGAGRRRSAGAAGSS